MVEGLDGRRVAAPRGRLVRAQLQQRPQHFDGERHPPIAALADFHRPNQKAAGAAVDGQMGALRGKSGGLANGFEDSGHLSERYG